MKYEKANMVIVFMELNGIDHIVGRLAYKERDIYFEYDADFLKTGIEISPFILPLRSGVIKCDDRTFDGLFGVFADSLPDGWGRLLIDRHMKKLGLNPFDLTPLDRLLFVGAYGMGAFRYEPDASLDITTPRNISLDEIAEYSHDILEGEADEMIESMLLLNGSSSGARPKAMMQVDDTRTSIINDSGRLCEGYSHWMVKFPSSADEKSVGAVEYAYSLMAKAAGINMPETHLFTTKNGAYFACKRFDRDGKHKVHTHSLAGLVHADFRHPALDYDDILKVTTVLTKNQKETEMAYRLACFNVLSRNRDDHAKNFSFVMVGTEWRFSPAYDLTFSGGPMGEQSTSVVGNGKDPSVKELLQLGENHLIRNREQIIYEVIEAIAEWRKFATIAGVPKKMLEMIAKNISTTYIWGYDNTI